MFIKVLNCNDILAGEMLGMTIHKKKLLIINVNNAIHVYEDKCAHLGVPLSLGTLKEGVITCSAHQWEYDAVSGQGINPCSAHLNALTIKIENNEIFVEL